MLFSTFHRYFVPPVFGLSLGKWYSSSPIFSLIFVEFSSQWFPTFSFHFHSTCVPKSVLVMTVGRPPWSVPSNAICLSRGSSTRMERLLECVLPHCAGVQNGTDPLQRQIQNNSPAQDKIFDLVSICTVSIVDERKLHTNPYMSYKLDNVPYTPAHMVHYCCARVGLSSNEVHCARMPASCTPCPPLVAGRENRGRRGQ